MMKFYINGRFLTQKTTGVQRYAIELVHALDEILDKENEFIKKDFVLLVPPQIIRNEIFRNIKIEKVGAFKGHIWEQFELPWYARNGFLINLCNCAPLIKKNQSVTIHDAAIAAFPYAYSWKFRTWYKFMYSIMGMRVRSIFTVSKFSRDELIKYFSISPRKIKITYNGANHIKKIQRDMSVFKRENIHQGTYVFGVSSRNPSKNFHVIMETAKRLPAILFIIAGGGNSKIFGNENYESLKNVRFIGYVTDEELIALYCEAKCFVYPSLYEGFGIPPMEAAAAGCKNIILSDIPVFKELYSNDVEFFHATDSDELAKKIQSVFEGKSEAKHYMSAVDKYSWNKSAKVLLEEIQEVCR